MAKANKYSQEELPDHINEYFTDSNENPDVQTSKELFRASTDDVDIKTDLNLQEIMIVSSLKANDESLKLHGLRPLYSDFLKDYLRLKISLDRKSRGEFVDMNRNGNKPEDLIQNASNVSNILGAKK